MKKNLEIGLTARGKGCMKWLPVVLVLIGRKAGLFGFHVEPWPFSSFKSGAMPSRHLCLSLNFLYKIKMRVSKKTNCADRCRHHGCLVILGGPLTLIERALTFISMTFDIMLL